MKRISDEQKKLIDDVIAESATDLSPAALEKDAVVTESLRAISEIALPGLTLTFSGGTCLSKAYGLLERMSEDIDLRLAVENRSTLSRSALRRSLRDLKESLTEALRSRQFELPDASIKARNENKFISFDLVYTSQYEQDIALRPSVRIEFMAIAPRLPIRQRTLRPLIDELTNRTTAPPVTLACLTIEETLCEKVISYLRRSLEYFSNREHSQYEERLARHVYDVHRIATRYDALAGGALPVDLFENILAAEAGQYGSRDEAFGKDPRGTLLGALDKIKVSSEFRAHYDRFAAELLYGEHRPGFDEAFATFANAARGLLRPTQAVGH